MRPQPTQPNAQTDRLNLREEHRLLDGQFNDLIRRTETGDWHECDAIWDAFSNWLEQHMADEERRLFPDYARLGPSAARLVQQLCDEHKELRRRLQSTGLAIQLHAVRAEEMEELVKVLREHAAREGQCIYPWLDAQRERSETPFGNDEAMI